MTGIETAPRRSRKELEDQGAVFYVDPEKYPYVREGRAWVNSPSRKPIRERFTGFYKPLLIGKLPAKYIGDGVYEVRFWYLKDYDLGMPEQKSYKKPIKGHLNKNGYYYWGNNIDGSPRVNVNPTIIPSEGVVFDDQVSPFETILARTQGGPYETTEVRE